MRRTYANTPGAYCLYRWLSASVSPRLALPIALTVHSCCVRTDADAGPRADRLNSGATHAAPPPPRDSEGPPRFAISPPLVRAWEQLSHSRGPVPRESDGAVGGIFAECWTGV